MQGTDWEALIEEWRQGGATDAKLGLAGLARHAATLSDAMLARAQSAHYAQGGGVSCRKGCAACCRQVIPLSPPDALALEELRQGMAWEERSEADARLDRMRDGLALAGLAEASLFNHAGEVYRLGLACPFLIEEACSIHPHRPLACREHLAVSSAASCGDFPSPFIHTLELPFSVGEALARTAAYVLSQPVETIPLARLPEWLSAHGGLAEREWDSAFLVGLLASHCRSQLTG